MLQEMRLALTLHRPEGHASPAPTAAQIFRMATAHGAATTPFGHQIGRIAPGCEADIVLLDWARVTGPWQDPSLPVLDVILRRARDGAVETVIVGGQTVYLQGQFPRVNRDDIHSQISETLQTPKSENDMLRQQMANAALPIIKKYYMDWEI
jgi:cytosine/adenosine deaminase-related metal-dependent hydrolase